MNKPKKYNIFPQMFDIKPTLKSGKIDYEKIMRVKRVLDLQAYFRNPEKDTVSIKFLKEGVKKVKQFDELDVEEKKVSFLVKSKSYRQVAARKPKKNPVKTNAAVSQRKAGRSTRLPPQFYKEKEESKEILEKIADRLKAAIDAVGKFVYRYRIQLFTPVIVLFLIVSTFAFSQNKNILKRKIEERGFAAYRSILEAKEAVEILDFGLAEIEFRKAGEKFTAARKEASRFGSILFSFVKYLPLSNKATSGVNLIESGERIAKAGELLSAGINDISSLNFNSFLGNDDGSIKRGRLPIDVLLSFTGNLRLAREELKEAKKNLFRVDSEKLLVQMRDQVNSLKEKIPEIESRIDGFLRYLPLVTKALGEKRKQTYLLVFQNPAELRATGGFIGSYGIVEIDRGTVIKVFVDDVFNADGQLEAKIIPPKPIQRISTAWSMHDANWFFDFPLSAKKIALFYERTGGSTPDAVIAINSNVLKTILKIVGPVPMPEYGVIVGEDNFEEVVQYKVEEDFDKELNQPKKILSDLAPKIIYKLGEIDKKEIPLLLSEFSDLFVKKDIMAFSTDEEIQKALDEFKVSGRIADVGGDYLAIAHSNLGGYKTDRVIEDEVEFQSEVQNDGSIINTVKITRIHKGGNRKYEWYNKVNTDYMRVYVPKGSALISAKGHTLDNFTLNFDYEKAYFKRDEDVLKVENSELIDRKSGTKIFEESGKTVFGNWVFVSPGKKVEVVYKYKLPFKFISGDSYQTYFQKQPGTNMYLKADVFGKKMEGEWDEDIIISKSSW